MNRLVRQILQYLTYVIAIGSVLAAPPSVQYETHQSTNTSSMVLYRREIGQNKSDALLVSKLVLFGLTLITTLTVLESHASNTEPEDEGGGGCSGSNSSCETPVHRYPTTIERGLTDCAPPNVATVYDALLHRVRLEPDKSTMGRRRVLGITERERRSAAGGEKGKTRKWSYFELSDYEWMTYREIHQFTLDMGAGLAHLMDDEPVAAGAARRDMRVAIYAPTSREWTLCMLSCYSQGMQVVTAYDTLGDEGLLHALNQTGAKVAFVKADQLPVLQRIGERIKSVESIVYYQDHYGMPKAAEAALEAVGRRFRVLTMGEVRAMGRQRPRDLRVASRDDAALVMYTSGTTGPPKGVLIAHGGLLAICGAIHELVPDYIDYETDRVLSYLPLSHVLAFFVETYCIYSGIRIGYGTPRTLTEDNVEGCLGDLRALQPAVMLGVPQVWNTIRASILRQVAQRPWVVQRIFQGAVELKTWLVYYGLPTGLLDRVVFRKTREGTGGRLKIGITGGAQVNPHVQKFIAATVCPMIHGYGLSEASGLLAVQIPGDVTLGNVGPPVPSVEIKLVDVPDAGYLARNQQGEIWVRGPSVFKGYLDQPELTRQTLTPDGWLRTGDIGQWTALGQLAVIDRRKNLVKLAHGEYIALEALESAYSNSKYVTNICVCADERMTRPFAIINMDPRLLAHWAREAGFANAATVAADELANDPAFIKLVYADLVAAAEQNSLQRQEVLADIRIDAELWTPENGLLTAASKLRRADIQKHNASGLHDMFRRHGVY
ncbi:long-chain fatty acid-CoA ligase [Coemansia sp. Benny D115]|nr:long-chain fatty acid-CoA ligase [Coemansia sp. Benny D115]